MGPAPRYFWLAATALVIIVALILLLSNVDFEDDDDIGLPHPAGIGLAR